MRINRLSIVLTICFSLIGIQQAFSQCGNRYKSEVFSSYTKSTVVYAVPVPNDSLKMDIYQPVGDSFAFRPVIIMAHGGSFVGGSRTSDYSVDSICQTMALRGYVTASIDYRLTSSLTNLIDSIKALDVVMKAIGDGKAAIRYFRKDAYTANIYHIDTNQIFIGGNSAGAILAVQLAYIDSLAQVPAYIQTVIDSNGGIEGKSGNPGYSSRVSAVINLAGGINNLDWYKAGDIPMVSCQGDQDQTVPYECDGVLKSSTMGLVKTINICGGGAMKTRADALNGGVEDSLLTFPGDDHVPWEGDKVKMSKVVDFVDSFIYKHTVCNATKLGHEGIDNIYASANFMVYPNPANSYFSLETSLTKPYSIIVYNTLGQAMLVKENIVGNHYTVETSSFSSGLYIIKVLDPEKQVIHTDKVLISK